MEKSYKKVNTAVEEIEKLKTKVLQEKVKEMLPMERFKIRHEDMPREKIKIQLGTFTRKGRL